MTFNSKYIRTAGKTQYRFYQEVKKQTLDKLDQVLIILLIRTRLLINQSYSLRNLDSCINNINLFIDNQIIDLQIGIVSPSIVFGLRFALTLLSSIVGSSIVGPSVVLSFRFSLVFFVSIVGSSVVGSSINFIFSSSPFGLDNVEKSKSDGSQKLHAISFKIISKLNHPDFKWPDFLTIHLAYIVDSTLNGDQIRPQLPHKSIICRTQNEIIGLDLKKRNSCSHLESYTPSLCVE